MLTYVFILHIIVLLYKKEGYIMLFIRTTNVIKPAGGGGANFATGSCRPAGGGPGNGGGGNIITPR